MPTSICILMPIDLAAFLSGRPEVSVLARDKRIKAVKRGGRTLYPVVLEGEFGKHLAEEYMSNA